MSRFPLVSSLGLALALTLPAYAGGDESAVYETLLAAKAPTVVSVKFVLHASMGGQNQESNQEVRGTVVDPTGVVMVGNDEFEGQMGAMKALMKARGMEITMSPADVKVLFGAESKEYPAVIVARDSNLGLAFVQILDLEGKTLEAIDLTKGGSPRIGQSIYGVTRKSRGFDCAPTIDRLFINGKVEKPRVLWSVSGTFGGKGLPVFDADGKPLGVYAHQKGSEGVDEDGSGGAGGLLAALGGATEGSCLLPLDAVLKSYEQAKKRIPDAVAKAKEAAAKSAEAPKEPAMDGAAPEAPKSPDAPKPPEAPSAPDAPKSPDAPKGDQPK